MITIDSLRELKLEVIKLKKAIKKSRGSDRLLRQSMLMDLEHKIVGMERHLHQIGAKTLAEWLIAEINSHVEYLARRRPSIVREKRIYSRPVLSGH